MILELFSSYLSLLKETTDVKILIDDLIIQNGTSKLAKLFLTYLVHHSASAFWFSWKMEASYKNNLSTFRIWKMELKNLISIKSYGSLKIV